MTHKRRSTDKPIIKTTSLEDRTPLEQAHALEYAALLISQKTEQDMRDTIRWQAKAKELIDGLLADARRLRALELDTGTAQATECGTNGTEGLRAELDAAKRALARTKSIRAAATALLNYDRNYPNVLSGEVPGLLSTLTSNLAAALAAKSTEQKPLNCKETGSGRGLCNMCAAGHYEKCLYVQQGGL